MGMGLPIRHLDFGAGQVVMRLGNVRLSAPGPRRDGHAAGC